MSAQTPTPADLAQLRDRTEGYLRSDPKNRELLIRATELNLALSSTDTAQGHVSAALALFPNDPRIQALQAHTLSAQHKWSEAAAIYSALLAKIRDAGLAHSLAHCQQMGGDHQAAFDTLWPFSAAAELPAASIIVLVRALHHIGKLEQARILIEQNAARLSQDAAFLGAASLVYFDSGDGDKATAMSQAALALGGRSMEALVVDASVALVNADADHALAAFNEALTINPGDGRSWGGAGEAHMLLQDFPAARTRLEKAVKIMPGHVGSWHALGWCYLLSQQATLAEKAFEHALDIDRNFAETHGSLAVVAAVKGERQRAEDAIQKALRLDPASLSARLAQMILDGRMGDADTFKATALRLIAGRKNTFGVPLADMVEKRLQDNAPR
jgi:tetratricopeptide (TPR) repeat protein